MAALRRKQIRRGGNLGWHVVVSAHWVAKGVTRFMNSILRVCISSKHIFASFWWIFYPATLFNAGGHGEVAVQYLNPKLQ